jgi:phage baseplate assembly protein V
MSDGEFRRLQMMLGRGRVTYVNDGGTIQKMQVRVNGLVTSDNRLRIPEFGFTSNPPVGSDVFYGAISGDTSEAAVVATNHQPSRPTGLQPGESMLYSQDGKQIYMTASGGIVVNANSQDVTVNGATTVTINAATEVLMNTPILKVSGDIVDNFETNSDTMAGMRTKYNAHTHNVVNVQTGGSTITSTIPSTIE